MSIRLGLVSFYGLLIAAWKGVPGDESQYYAQFDGTSWKFLGKMPGTSSVGPSLAATNGNTALYAAWKGPVVWGGRLNDYELHYAQLVVPMDTPVGKPLSSFSWTPVGVMPGVSSADGVALLALDDTILLAAGTGGLVANDKGFSVDSCWCSTAELSMDDGTFSAFTAPQPMNGYTASGAPALAADANHLGQVSVTTASGSDELYECGYSTGTVGFSSTGPGIEQEWPNNGGLLNGVKSYAAPSISNLGNDGVYVVWRDEASGVLMFDAWGLLTNPDFEQNEATPVTLPDGVTAMSSDAPAVAEYNGLLYVIWKGAGADEQIHCAAWAPLSETSEGGWSAVADVPGKTGSEPIRIHFPLP